MEHKIELVLGSLSIHQQLYKAAMKERETERLEMSRMLKERIIDPSHSKYASPMVLIQKPDGSLWLYVEYRWLNCFTVLDAYQIPRMDEVMDSIGDGQMVSTMYCNVGYCKVPT